MVGGRDFHVKTIIHNAYLSNDAVGIPEYQCHGFIKVTFQFLKLFA